MGKCACGRPIRFNGKTCSLCRKAAAEARDLAVPVSDLPELEDPPELDRVSSSLRFQVRRLRPDVMVFLAVDTLTNTVREVSSDPLDVAGVCSDLNGDLIYAMGRRWEAPA